MDVVLFTNLKSAKIECLFPKVFVVIPDTCLYFFWTTLKENMFLIAVTFQDQKWINLFNAKCAITFISIRHRITHVFELFWFFVSPSATPPSSSSSSSSFFFLVSVSLLDSDFLLSSVVGLFLLRLKKLNCNLKKQTGGLVKTNNFIIKIRLKSYVSFIINNVVNSNSNKYYSIKTLPCVCFVI